MVAVVNDKLIPPGNDNPVADDGQHTQSWLGYHQAVADQINNLRSGRVDGLPAAPGQVGEVIVSVHSPVVMFSGVAADIASLMLDPGDWDVSGNVRFVPDPTTHPLDITGSVSLASGAFGLTITSFGAAFTVGAALAVDAGGVTQVNVSASTVVYLVARAGFTGAGMSAIGIIRARRMQ